MFELPNGEKWIHSEGAYRVTTIRGETGHTLAKVYDLNSKRPECPRAIFALRDEGNEDRARDFVARRVAREEAEAGA